MICAVPEAQNESSRKLVVFLVGNLKKHHMCFKKTPHVFRFTKDVEIECTKRPHSYEDVPMNITGIDPKPVDFKLLHKNDCAVSETQNESSPSLWNS